MKLEIVANYGSCKNEILEKIINYLVRDNNSNNKTNDNKSSVPWDNQKNIFNEEGKNNNSDNYIFNKNLHNNNKKEIYNTKNSKKEILRKKKKKWKN